MNGTKTKRNGAGAAAAPDPTKDILDALRLLLEPGSVVEIRVPEFKAGRFTKTAAGYFDHGHLDELARAALNLSGRAPGVYLTINPVLPDLLARYCNRVEVGAKATTQDGQITRRRWLILDLDPERPTGICATEEEKQAAIRKAQEIKVALLARGWPEPIEIDSGSGRYLLFRVDLPTDDGGLLQRVTEALAGRFNDGVVKVDKSVHNAARIIRIPGTLNCKGDSTEARPHRLARVLHAPEGGAQVVDRVLLETLAAEWAPQAKEAPKAAPASKPRGKGASRTGGRRLDLRTEEGFREWVQQHLAGFGPKEKSEAGRLVFQLERCPFEPDHGEGYNVTVSRSNDGVLGFHCHGERCTGKHWPDLRELLEPGARERGARRAAEEAVGEDPELDPLSAASILEGIVERAKADRRELFKAETLEALAVLAEQEPGEYGAILEQFKAARIRTIELRKQVKERLQRRKLETRRRAARVERGDKPLIKISVDVSSMADAAELAILNHHKTPTVFQRGGSLVRLVRDAQPPQGMKRASGALSISAITKPALLECASRAAQWVMIKPLRGFEGEFEEKPSLPPEWLLEVLLNRGEWRFPVLEGVVECPVLRPDGTVLDSTGYDKETGLYLDPGGFSFPPIPARPSLAAARKALEIVLEVVGDFPFDESSDGAAAVAAFLTMVGRPAIDGPCPNFLIRASTPGSGKTLLADTISMTTTGRQAPRWTPTDDPIEDRKRLLAVALEGDRLILIDNVAFSFGNPALDAVATSRTIKDRVLGSTKNVMAPWNAVIFVTGNNLAVKGDQARRVVPIDMNPKVERPEERGGFRHGDLLSWISNERGRIVAALLTILRGYIVAGRPAHGWAQYGSFERWSDLIRGALYWLNLPDPIAGRERIIRSSDPAMEALRNALHSWRAFFGDEALTISAAVGMIEGTLSKDSVVDSERAQLAGQLKEALGALDTRYDGRHLNPTRLGYAFRSKKNRVVGGFAFVEAGVNRTATTQWRAISFAGDAGNAGDSSSPTRAETNENLQEPDVNSMVFTGAGWETSPASPSSPAQSTIHDHERSTPETASTGWRIEV